MNRAEYLRAMYEAESQYAEAMTLASEAYASLTPEERDDTEVAARYTALKQALVDHFREQREALVSEQGRYEREHPLQVWMPEDEVALHE